MEIKHFFLLLKRIALIVLIYTLCRFIFYFSNLQQFHQADWGNTLLAFLLGLKFDLSIICITNSLFIILSILPFNFLNNEVYQKILNGLFLTVNIPMIVLNMIDVELFKFRGKKSTYHILGMAEDIKDQSFQILFHYWYIVLLSAGLIYLLIRLYPKNSNSPSRSIHYAIGFLIYLVFLGFTFLGMRGGLQLKPLRPNHAFVLSPNILGNVALNTPFAFLMTIDIQGIEPVNYYKSRGEVLSKIDTVRTYHFPGARKENVVIIILESFGAEYWGAGNTYKGYTPFLDSLSTEGLFIKNHFANGKTSMDAVPAILAGIPAMMEEPYITSIYQTNKINGLGSALKQQGYNTSFFHAARNGSMGFDVFTKNAGFERYYGLNEYPYPEDFDGNWGVYDEPFLQFFCKEISGYPQPFLSCVFTISSHQPYSIPAKYKNRFPKGPLDIHESLGYTDYSLREFFNTAKKQGWYENTLFIITGDHTQMNNEKAYKNIIGDFNVPLLLFHPTKSLPAPDTAKITQHTDIMPTVLDYLNIRNEKQLYFGRSVFEKAPGLALSYSNMSYRIIHADYFLEMTMGHSSRLYDFTNDKAQKHPVTDKPEIKKKYEEELKAYIQYFNNGINENSWYEWNGRLSN
ncbi:MAG: LTA synthase family protein [Cytophagaceae bacterium]